MLPKRTKSTNRFAKKLNRKQQQKEKSRQHKQQHHLQQRRPLQQKQMLAPALMARLLPLPGSQLPAVAAGGIVTLMGKARSILEEKGASLTEDAPTMVVHDLAGQRMYYTLHRILLTEALTQVRSLPP